MSSLADQLAHGRAFQINFKAVVALVALLLMLVFWFDSQTPLGFAHGMLYVPVIFLALLTSNARFLIATVLVSALLTVAGVLISEGPAFEVSVVFANRAVALLIILVSGALAYSTLAIAKAQQRHQHFAQLTDALPIIIWMANAKGEVDFLNQALYDYTGISRDDGFLPGQWLELVHPDDREPVTREWMNCVAQHKPYSVEFRIRRSDGHYGHFLVRAVLFEKGQTKRWYGSAMEMDEYRQLQLQLAHSKKLEAIGQLTGGMAHDFNNLLTVVLGNADLLSASLSDQPSLKDLSDTIIQAAERGALLNQSLLAFARRQALSPVLTDIGQLVEEIQPLLYRSLDESISLTVKVESGQLSALVDRAQLESALLNLCLNARDAMPEGGALNIEVSECQIHSSPTINADQLLAGNYIQISVQDTGKGIPADIREQVFEPFFTTKDQGKGSGLGLSMAFGFVKQSGGHIRFESEPECGTTFHIYLPKDTVQTPLYQDKVPGKTATGTGTILLVEDEELVRRYALRILGEAGYSVILAEHADEALKKLEKNPGIQLLFTDIVMPGSMNGLELVERALQQYPSLKIVYTSGHNNEELLQQPDWETSAHFIAKPYRRAELLTLFSELLNTSDRPTRA